MLELKQIKKDYLSGENCVHALNGIDIQFRESEFVSILGPSGCGKTTLLNIIGGLDHYTSGDLLVNHTSTKHFKDSDWDTYRNHTIGFVFQSYNLIPHQSVLSNVELALTLSGVSKEERRKRAADALKQVGLEDQLHKRPNQMSGGQMQRVAIARALVNNPDILLADEPTGALDSKTSVQIMEILKEVAKDRLVIMVTHNPDLANQYSTRIISLSDGQIVHDSDPYQTDGKTVEKITRKGKKPSLLFRTALSLSLNNLMTKKARTFMVSFAGSIGIIGIALILAISNGTQNYITSVEEETLSSYPIQIESTAMDMGAMMSTMMTQANKEVKHQDGKIYTNFIMNEILDSMVSEMNSNDLKSFKTYLEKHQKELSQYANDVVYTYSTPLHVYLADTSEDVVQVNPSQIMDEIGFNMAVDGLANTNMMMGTDAWVQLLNNEKVLDAEYEVLAGRLPQAYNEVVVIADQNGEISDYALYSIGLKDSDEVKGVMKKLLNGEEIGNHEEEESFAYEELLALRFKLVVNTDYYEKQGNRWIDQSEDEDRLKEIVAAGENISVVGVVKATDMASITPSQCIGYRGDLMTHLIERVNESEIVKAQQSDPEINVFTGMKFSDGESSKLEMSALSAEERLYLASLSEAELAQLMAQYKEEIDATYESNLEKLGVADVEEPFQISIYPKDFEAKEQIAQMISDYNDKVLAQGKENLVIQYTDIVKTMMSSVTDIINSISYILVAFVAISLIVSSIMIGIITYISVLERTKEIGVLRSIGASKRDISRVFNAETLIVGFCAGAFGVLVTVLLSMVINAVVADALSIENIASLPIEAAIILICISMALTLIAGLFPARFAAKQDPVKALRTE